MPNNVNKTKSKKSQTNALALEKKSENLTRLIVTKFADRFVDDGPESYDQTFQIGKRTFVLSVSVPFSRP